MATAGVERLRSIKTLSQLISHLKDELGWPIDTDDVDDLTFDWTDDLGLAEEHRVNIKHIKQLRPLDSRQPWGIFFVEFEKKKLPIVVLRRILSHLVVKKRAAAKKANSATWHANDLLFVSAFGEESSDQREIAFAHFHQEGADLPALRVLGWDGADTPLKLEHVAATLKAKLHWPAKPADHAAWRAQWSAPFRHRVGHVVRTADSLAEVLAALARRIRNAAHTLMKAESDRGPLRRLYKAFQATLIHDLTEVDFADTYAQTITYGLLTAAISQTVSADHKDSALSAEDVAEMVPITNPFLRDILQTFLKVGGRKGGIDFDELGIQDVVELLRGEETDLPAILRDFGNRNPGEDPVIHFYEHFLAAYDSAEKIKRGVFYTPQPVVSCIVRSVHELLQAEFGLADGLADTTTWGEMVKKHPSLKLPPLSDELGEKRTISPDEPFVQILDPATGTATFLVEVIDVIYRTLVVKWKHQRLTDAQQHAAWNDYVPKHLLPRLHAFELMMAPYAIAHMKIGLKLAETGYRFGTEERARIYLTNALEPKVKQLPQIGFDALAHEAAAVNEIKWHKRFTVVIGNPPYSGISSNMTEYAQHIVDAYKIVDGGALNERKLWLQDDYVKFIRKAQTIIDITNVGVFGYITNHGYLGNPTFRGMRQSLMRTFPRLRVIDLHGNANKKEQSPDGSEDKNVFDIRQGVAICLASRSRADAVVAHGDLWGSRESKYAWLTKHRGSDTDFAPLTPDSPFYFFEPQNTDCRAEYDAGWKITDMFPTHGVGVVMARDSMTVDFDSDALWQRVKDFASLPPEKARTKYDLGKDARDWQIATAQADIQASGPSKKKICPILYRPFDRRFTYYTGNSRGFYASPCRKVMSNMLGGDNLGIALSRSVEIGQFEHVFCTKGIVGHHSVSLKEVNYLFPLWLVPTDDAPLSLLKEDGERQPNFAPSFLHALATSLSLKETGPHGLPTSVTPEDIAHYVYAALHSPGYRSRYAESLKIDFPRLPLTGNLELFRALARLGGELVATHLMESPRLDTPITEFIGGRNPEVEKTTWSKKTVWVDAEQTIGFKGVPENVWNFHIGGYQVCEKWLKDRKGRVLTKGDIDHYQRIVVALHETIRIMAEIDKVIEKHGGWPIK